MQSDVIVLGKAEQAKSSAEPEGNVPFTRRCGQAGAWDQPRGSPGAPVPGVPHPGCPGEGRQWHLRRWKKKSSTAITAAATKETKRDKSSALAK